MSYDYPNYDNFNVYGLQRELGWPTQQQPAVSQQPQFLPNYHVPPAPNPALHVAYPMQSQGPVPTLHEPSEPKYSARNLLDIVQTAIEVGLLTAKHGEKGKKLIEFGTAVHKLGIPGSDATLKSRLLEVMNFHEDPATAPAPIVKAIEGSHYEITLGAPDVLKSTCSGFVRDVSNWCGNHKRMIAIPLWVSQISEISYQIFDFEGF
ncbi:hypothetical protein B0H14DRAFT_2783520 [Mycena olivaceomarginata]|nr:hypothetical protein B0H14DRAFT_2783520 [Mycena olivaceomarginata]